MTAYVTRRSLSRRTFLRGTGATLALPCLGAMTPAFGRAPQAPRRAVFVFYPNGVHRDRWFLDQDGPLTDLSETLAPLTPHRDRLLVYRGLTLNGARPLGDGPGDHARAASAFLTSSHPFKTKGEDIRIGTSVDQALVQSVPQETRFASLELGCERGRSSGSCDSGYSCAYSNNIAWRDERTPVTKEVSPTALFDRLFGTGGGGDPETQRARRARRQSVLDLVLGQARSLEAQLDGTDRQRLDQYLTSIREVEQRAQALEGPALPAGVERPDGPPEDHREHLRLMYELLALALETDRTRVATFMTGNAGSNRSYRWLDVPHGHHELSHHQKDPKKLAQIARIDRFHLEEFARFLDRLAGINEGGRDLLDQSLVLFGSGISDGNRHNHDDLPILVAGKGGGGVETGQHVTVPRETPLANLYLSMLHHFGARTPTFGDSNGTMAEFPPG